MAYLNQQQRTALRDELKALTFDKAKSRLRRMDPQGRLVYFRNVQTVDQWTTRFELARLGARVTLVETLKTQGGGTRQKVEYELVDVIVEPTPDNHA